MSIKKHIPNTITCCNLISGCIATSYAFGGSPKLALLWIIIGATFDFFDGMSARLLGRRCNIRRGSCHYRLLTALRDELSTSIGTFASILALCCFHHCGILGIEIGEVQLGRTPDHFLHRSPYASQCPLLGLSDCLRPILA